MVMPRWTTMALELQLRRAAAAKSSKQQRVLKGCERYRPMGQMLNTLWLSWDRARARATVRAWPQHKTEEKKTIQHLPWRTKRWREEKWFCCFKENEFIIQDQTSTCETSGHWIKSNQAVIKDLTYLEKELHMFLWGGHIFDFFPGVVM